LVTGGSEGIGAASVRRFLDRNWRVATVSLPGQNLHRWRWEGAVTLEGDITKDEVRKHIVEETLARFGRVDALVNNVGVGLYATCSDVSPQLFRRLLEVNVIAPLALTQLVLPVMRNQGSGTIVNLGSVAGNVSMPWAFGYCASKSALHALNDSLRRELRKERIRVVKICPGIVETRFRENVLGGVVPASLKNLRPVVSADQVSEAILKAVESRASGTVYVPGLGRLFTAMEHCCPPLMDWYLGRFGGAPLVAAIATEMSLASHNEVGAKL
jgi:short-subunit dehydrogenase